MIEEGFVQDMAASINLLLLGKSTKPPHFCSCISRVARVRVRIKSVDIALLCQGFESRKAKLIQI